MEVARLVQEYYKPKLSVIVQRFKFNSRHQENGESISVFLAELRNLSQDCEFGPTLDEMLRDRLVCGTSNEKIQKRLFSEPKLTLKRALELALAIEMAEKDVADLNYKAPNIEESVNKMHINKPPKVNTGNPRKYHRDPALEKSSQCPHCNGLHEYESSACYYENARCYSCGRKDHISCVCHNKGKAQNPQGPQGTHHLIEKTGNLMRGRIRNPMNFML